MNNQIQMFLVCGVIVFWRKVSNIRNSNSVPAMSSELFYNQLCERGYQYGMQTVKGLNIQIHGKRINGSRIISII